MTRTRAIALARKLSARAADPSSSTGERAVATRRLRELVAEHGLTEEEAAPIETATLRLSWWRLLVMEAWIVRRRWAGRPWTQEDAEHAAACGVPMAEDAVQIAGMLEYMGTAPLPGRPDSDVVPRWRCKHLQGCGDCGIYATRPALCRDHAEVRGSVCDVETCARRPLLTGPTTAQVTEVSMLRLVPSAGERAFVDACREAERYGSPRVWEDEP